MTDIAATLGRCLTRVERLAKAVGEDALRQEIQSALSGIASEVAGLITAYRVLEERNQSLLHLSRRDEVTGLYNQRYFMERLDEEFRRTRRYNAPLSLLIADLDGFKVFNDAQGHPVGDELLRHVSGVIRQTIRAADIASRHGGDEFGILLPQTTQERATRLAERVRAAVAALPQNVSVSIGVASLQVWMSGALDLVTEADHAMYQAKAQGRNRVVTGAIPSWTSGVSSSV